jgi:hypothetical protein
MSEKRIDTFYIIDFDRCLGSVDASFSLLASIIEEMGVVASDVFQKARAETEAKGISFTVFGFLKEYTTDEATQTVVDEFVHRGHAQKDSLLEAGARHFIDWLDDKKRQYGIMSYGDPIWQPTKIVAAGLGSIPRQIINDPYKAHEIATWYDQNDEQYHLPEVFGGYISRTIVLIDDKASAFDNLPAGTRGYWVLKNGIALPFQAGPVPPAIITVDQIDKIIDYESNVRTL